jgi:redox-sensing transcriptional repressor
VKTAVPRATVQRLPMYLKVLDEVSEEGISSEELAAAAGVNSAKVRKDLSYLGSYGVRGVGYEVEHLRYEVRRALGLTKDWRVAIVGLGNLGLALANYRGFAEEGFVVVGLFDSDPGKIGAHIDTLEIEPMERLFAAVKDRHISIGMITTPAGSAQEVADILAESGVKSILNFAPAHIQVPEGVDVRRVDLSTELKVLSYYLHRAGADA